MQLKQIPEDFIVEEVLDLKLEAGPYFYYKVEKKNWNTLAFVRELQMRLHVKDVGYAGLKDKHAITAQYISVKKKISFSIPDVTCTLLGTGKQRIYLGMHTANRFSITVRDLEKELPSLQEILNLYGEQRFSKNNATLGNFLVHKKFKEACALLSLPVEGNDYVGALKHHGMQRLRLYVIAFQSLLWNRLAQESTEATIPILGFLTEGEAYAKIMEEEGITVQNFQLRSIPGLAAEGGERKRVVAVEDFNTHSFGPDDLTPGKMKQVVSFSLPQGAYATEVIRCMAQSI